MENAEQISPTTSSPEEDQNGIPDEEPQAITRMYTLDSPRMTPSAEAKFANRYVGRTAAYVIHKYKDKVWESVQASAEPIAKPVPQTSAFLPVPPLAQGLPSSPRQQQQQLRSPRPRSINDKEKKDIWFERIERKEKALVDRLRKQVVDRSLLVNEFNQDLNNVIIARFGGDINAVKNNNDAEFIEGEAEALAAVALVSVGHSKIGLTEWIEPEIWKPTWKRKEMCEKCSGSSLAPCPLSTSIFKGAEDQPEIVLEREGKDEEKAEDCVVKDKVIGCKHCDCVAHYGCLVKDRRGEPSAEQVTWICESCVYELQIARARYDAYQTALYDAKMLRISQIRVAKRWRTYKQLNRFRRKKAAILLLQRMFRRRMLMRAVNEERREMMRPLVVHISKAINLPLADLLTKTCDTYISVTVQKRTGEIIRRLTTSSKSRTLNPIWEESLLIPAVTGNSIVIFTLMVKDDKRETPSGQAILDLARESTWRYGGSFTLSLQDSKSLLQRGGGGGEGKGGGGVKAETSVTSNNDKMNTPNPPTAAGAAASTTNGNEAAATGQGLGKISFEIRPTNSIKSVTAQLSGPDLSRLIVDPYSAVRRTKTLCATLVDGQLMLYQYMQEAEPKRIIDVRTSPMRYEVHKDESISIMFPLLGPLEIKLTITDFLEQGTIDRWVTALEVTRGLHQGLSMGQIVKKLGQLQMKHGQQRQASKEAEVRNGRMRRRRPNAAASMLMMMKGHKSNVSNVSESSKNNNSYTIMKTPRGDVGLSSSPRGSSNGVISSASKENDQANTARSTPKKSLSSSPSNAANVTTTSSLSSARRREAPHTARQTGPGNNTTPREPMTTRVLVLPALTYQK